MKFFNFTSIFIVFLVFLIIPNSSIQTKQLFETVSQQVFPNVDEIDPNHSIPKSSLFNGKSVLEQNSTVEQFRFKAKNKKFKVKFY